MKNVIYVVAAALWLGLVVSAVIFTDAMIDQTTRGDSLVIGAVTTFIVVFGAMMWALVEKLVQRG